MTIIEALVQLRDDLKLWVTNNLAVIEDAINNKKDFSGKYKDLSGAPSITENSTDELLVTDQYGNAIFMLDENGVKTTEVSANKISNDADEILVTDKYGNAIVRIADDGVTATTVSANMFENDTSDLIIADDAGHTILQINNKGVKTTEISANKIGDESNELIVTDLDGNTILLVNKDGVKTTDVSTNKISDESSDFIVADQDGNTILKVDKNGLSTPEIDSNKIKDSSNEFIITDIEGNTILKADKEGLKTTDLWLDGNSIANNLRTKLDKNLGAEESGKILAIDEEGNIVPVENNTGGTGTGGAETFVINIKGSYVTGIWVADKTYREIYEQIKNGTYLNMVVAENVKEFSFSSGEKVYNSPTFCFSGLYEKEASGGIITKLGCIFTGIPATWLSGSTSFRTYETILDLSDGENAAQLDEYAVFEEKDEVMDAAFQTLKTGLLQADIFNMHSSNEADEQETDNLGLYYFSRTSADGKYYEFSPQNMYYSLGGSVYGIYPQINAGNPVEGRHVTTKNYVDTAINDSKEGFCITVTDGIADKTYEALIAAVEAGCADIYINQIISVGNAEDPSIIYKRRYNFVGTETNSTGTFPNTYYNFSCLEEDHVYCGIITKTHDTVIDNIVVVSFTETGSGASGAGGDCAFTDDYKSAIEDYVLEVDLNGADAGDGTEGWQGYFDVDDTLSLVGVAADAKKTGDELARLNEMLGGSSVSDQIAEALVEVYVQGEEPVDAEPGSIWVDTNVAGLPEGEDKTAKVYLVDAGTSDISSVDLSEYKVGDVLIVTTS